MKDLLLTFAQKVSLALSRAVHVLIREDKLNYFKFPSQVSKILFVLVAVIISEAWDVELESAHFFVVIPSEKNSVLRFAFVSACRGAIYALCQNHD